MLGSQMRENEGIYLWLQLAGRRRAARLPPALGPRPRRAAAEAQREAERNGTGVQMRLPFEPSLDDREPKFYALPQPALPPKDLAAAAGRRSTSSRARTPEPAGPYVLAGSTGVGSSCQISIS